MGWTNSHLHLFEVDGKRYGEPSTERDIEVLDSRKMTLEKIFSGGTTSFIYEYDLGDYPVARELCDTYTIVHGIHAPNDTALMRRFVEAFQKVFGNLDEVLQSLADYMQMQRRTRGKVTAALIYPAVICSVGVLVVGFLVTFVVPKISQVLVESGKVLPLPTQVLMAVSAGVRDFWWLGLIGVVAAAVGLKAGFVARGFSGNVDHLADLITQGMDFPGFALIDILQPCVSFNKVNTFAWYKKRCQPLPEDYDPTDWETALKTAHEWGDRIPLGLIYRDDTRVPLERRLPGLKHGPLVGSGLDRQALKEVMEEYL